MNAPCTTYPVPAGIPPSTRYAVTVDGQPSFTYLTTGPAEAEFTAGHTASWTSFDLHAGEFVGLLGPNGAGKSTLFQIMTGLVAADKGQVELFGMTHRENRSGILSRVGVVFQARSVDLDMSVTENLRFHGRLFGLARTQLVDRIDQVLGQFGLFDLSKRKVRQLSGGQQRKVEIARAMLNDPALLIMDEPSAGLDTPSRRILVQDIRDLTKDKDVSVLWATHLVDEVDLADRVIILRQGQVIADGTPAELCATAKTDDLTTAYTILSGDQGAD